MNYVVKCDGQTLYNEYSDDCFIINDELSLVANELGSFLFSIYPEHPLYDSIELKRSVIKIYKDDALKMIFRPMEQHDDLDGLRTIYCEGCLSYFKDSLMRPFDFGGSPAAFFHRIITQHNSQVSAFQRLTEGTCTVTDPNNYVKRSSTFYNVTWDVIKDKMLNMGGYLVVTFDQNENPVVNWLSSITDVCSQEIAVGENLTSYERSLLYSDFCTACVPLGAQRADGTRLTIEDVNEDHDYVDYLINDSLAATYGVIYANPEDTTWDDVTNDWNLLTKGERWLDESGVKYKKKIVLTAEDISFINADVDSFEFMKKVYFKNSFGVSNDYIIAKFSVAITNKYSLNVELIDESYEYVNEDFTAISIKHNRTVSEKVQKTEEDKVNKENVLDAINTIYADDPTGYIRIGNVDADEVDAVLYDLQRARCFVEPSSVGWYRVYKTNWEVSDIDYPIYNGGFPFSVDITLLSHANYNSANDAAHFIRFNKLKNSAFFDCEVSRGNSVQIDKIRYVEDVNLTQQNDSEFRYAYIDIHFSVVPDYWSYCVLDLKSRDRSTQSWFDTIRRTTKVDDSPSDQTIVAEYTFEQNVNKFSGLKTIGNANVGGALSVAGDTTVDGGFDVSGDETVGGAFIVTNRRAYLRSNVAAGWHRVLEFAPTTASYRLGRCGVVIDFDITRYAVTNETHHISLSLVEGKVKFYGEASNSNAQYVDKIRYVHDSSKGYVDVHLSSIASYNFAVDYHVSASAGSFLRQITTKNLENVADTPTGETVLAEYTFIDNTDIDKITLKPVSGSSYSTYGGCYYERKNGLTHVHIGISDLTANATTGVLTLPEGVRPSTRVASAGLGGTLPLTAAGQILTSGIIQINSAGTYAMVDFWYAN